MTVRDHHGHALSGASSSAAEQFQKALHAHYCYAGDPVTLLDAAIADSPAFVMAHALKAYLHLVGANAEAAAVGIQALEAAQGLSANTREQGHVAALKAMSVGQLRQAGRILEDVSVDHPHDGLALQSGHLIDFLVGDSRMLRDRIGRALPHWQAGRPDHHAVLGMMAFGLEEMGEYARAEAMGRQAVQQEPRNGWAQHAVAHVLEMQDRRRDGVAWMRADVEAWTHESFFAVHNWWHLALFHLGLDEIDEVLRLYDGPIYGAPSDMAFDMVDAAALLWRLRLMGVDLGGRWDVLADVYATQPRGLYAFDDAHAMMALVGSGRMDDAARLLDLQASILGRGDDNALFVGEVGLPLMEGLLAFGRGDHDLACDRLRIVRNRAARFGGSHAQRDVIDLTLIEAARRGGHTSLEQALLAERVNARPQVVSPGRLAA